MKNVAIFASGSGTNFEALAEAIENKKIKANLLLMVTDNPNAYVIKRASNHNVETLIFNPKDYAKKSDYEAMIVKRLDELKIDIICLAGYMRICGKTLLSSYEGKIINIHPALLPSFKGAHGILDAYNYGVKVFGVTVHFVDAGMDSGKIIDQEAFHVDEDDSIDDVEEKIHAIEHVLYPKVLKKLCEEN